MINLGEWGAIAGSITAIVSLILLVSRDSSLSFLGMFSLEFILIFLPLFW
ncbi:hypothetical protein OK7_06294, partial [Enterococcus faecium EnGen0024]